MSKNNTQIHTKEPRRVTWNKNLATSKDTGVKLKLDYGIKITDSKIFIKLRHPKHSEYSK
jgi:hypothetical protein